ncbi:MAG: GNAT family N-acetyltransferase [Nevskiaceae bacterium]|nr:MAG: GNAT family N-acetyltransferase [Nevskiaceae bacterium]
MTTRNMSSFMKFSQFHLEIGSGRLKDVLFFVHQIILGARNDRFCTTFLHPSRQAQLTMECCRALLRQAFWDFIGRSVPIGSTDTTFLAAHCGEEPVGGVLVRRMPANDGAVALLIDVVVVAAAWQRRGIGKRMLEEVLIKAPSSAALYCACTPYAESMMQLLLRLGFRCVQASRVVNNAVTLNIFEKVPR